MSKKAKLRLVVYIAASVLLTLFTLLLILLVNVVLLLHTPDKLKGDFTVTFDDKNENTKPYLVQSVNVNNLYRYGNWYVDFNEIVNIYGFSVSGDRSDLRYIFRNESDDIMCVDLENNTVKLNGVSVYCKLPELGSDGRVYLPIDIINTYFEGLDVTYDTDEKLLLISCDKSCYLNVRNPDTTPKIDKVQIP